MQNVAPLIPYPHTASLPLPGFCRVMLSSDWHLDKSTAGLPRFDDVTSSVLRAAALAATIGCHWFGFLGDLTDPEAGAHRCVQFAINLADWLRSKGVPSFWLGGNHDAVEDAAGSSTLDPLAAHAQTYTTGGHRVQKVHVFTEPGMLSLAPGVQLVALPHPHRGKPYDPDAWVRQDARIIENSGKAEGIATRSVLVAGHLEVDAYERPDVPKGSESTVMPRGRLGRFPVTTCRELWGDRAVLVNGHYHRAHGAHDPVMVPGSLERLDRSEASHMPRVMVLDLPAGGA